MKSIFRYIIIGVLILAAVDAVLILLAGPRAFAVGLNHYLVVAALLFVLGLLTVATRRNAVAILMGVELILNGASLNFVAFARYTHGGIAGQVFSLFIILLAAAEACIALAILLAIYRNFKGVDIFKTTTLRE
jgi:NADH-quinone oxidoreductase subunit K